MATLKLLILSMACMCASAIPKGPPIARNTIFGEERLKGETFENVDVYEDISLFDGTEEAYRLPTTTRPTHYNVLWNMDMTRLSYSGEVSMLLVATQPGVNEIVIHSDHTELTSLSLRQGDMVIPHTYTIDEVHQFLRIRPNADLMYNPITPTVYNLTIQFGAEMRTDMYGIYRSWFRNNYTDTVR